MTLNYDQLAERAIDRYYDDDITDENTLMEYIDDSHIYPTDDDWTLRDRFGMALAADLHDLLKNGNDEDLAWEEDEVEALRTQGDYHINLAKISQLIAEKLLTRIYG